MILDRRRFLRLAAGGTALGAGAAAFGWQEGRRLPLVVRHDIEARGLPPAFDGFRVLHVSDIHAGPELDTERVARTVAHANALEADLIVLAGDLVDGHATLDEIEGCAGALRALRAPHGVVAVPGNHEHFTGIGRVTAAFREVGLTLLRGDHRVVERAGDAIAVLGVDDPLSAAFDPPQDESVAAACAGAPPELFRILVAHRPAAFDAAGPRGVALTLSGHTHGGQIGVPWTSWTPVRLATRYVGGRYRRDDAHLVVSTGVGTSGIPFRVGVPPSVCLLTLRSSKA